MRLVIALRPGRAAQGGPGHSCGARPRQPPGALTRYPRPFIPPPSYNGWTDGLRKPNGACLNCFMPGLDIRLPQPEMHECGPLCGTYYFPPNCTNATGGCHRRARQRLPAPVRRALLAERAKVGTGGYRRTARAGRRRGGLGAAHDRSANDRKCAFFWSGAVRHGNNPERAMLMRVANQSGFCVRNILEAGNVQLHKVAHELRM